MISSPFFLEQAGHPQKVDRCGLGLRIVRRIVHADPGTLEIISEPDRETPIVVRSPVAEQPNSEPL
jgi:signal transduction histidine kinase